MTKYLTLAALLLLIGCAREQTPPPHPVNPVSLPQKLSYDVGGAWGGGSSVRLDGETVILDRHAAMDQRPTAKRPRKIKVRPSDEQWEEFWRRVAILQVFQRKSNYDPAELGVIANDGTQWHLELAYRGKRVSTRGDNTYPSAKNVKAASFNQERFRMFEDALEKLIGHPLE
jgi:hypothetical protein